MNNLSTSNFRSIKDVEKELDKYRPLNLKTIAMLMEKMVQMQIERDIDSSKRILNALEKSRDTTSIPK